jgi:catechol 2,3-dioxygenase-like lactoylglutathione lyase family enzyme
MKLIIDIKVTDLERAVSFYTDILGFTCRRKEKDWAAISVGDAEIHLYLNGGVTGHVEFYVDDINAEVKRLRDLGVVFLPGNAKPSAQGIDENNVTLFPWGKTAFFRDSEGNELAIVKDNQ